MFGMEQRENKWRGPEGDVKIKKFKENLPVIINYLQVKIWKIKIIPTSKNYIPKIHVHIKYIIQILDIQFTFKI